MNEMIYIICDPLELWKYVAGGCVTANETWAPFSYNFLFLQLSHSQGIH